MNRGTERLSRRPPMSVFLAATVLFFFLSLAAADSIGFVPYYVDGTTPRERPAARASAPVHAGVLPLPQLAPAPPQEGEVLPVRIVIPAIELNLPVSNPPTRDIVELDEELKEGPARHMDSGKLGGAGNVLIFAHSSRLPVVRNQMYKAFNSVSALKEGDAITLVGEDGMNYLYSVTGLRTANADEEGIDLSLARGARLTLVTCDTLSGKSARFVLEADFIGTSGS